MRDALDYLAILALIVAVIATVYGNQLQAAINEAVVDAIVAYESNKDLSRIPPTLDEESVSYKQCI